MKREGLFSLLRVDGVWGYTKRGHGRPDPDVLRP